MEASLQEGQWPSGCNSVVECEPGIHEVLGLIPSTVYTMYGGTPLLAQH